MRRSVAVLLAFGAACTPGGEGGEAPPAPAAVSTVTQANHGTPTPEHRYAVAVCGRSSGPGSCPDLCSGTLIAPNLVLTARHCIDHNENGGTRISCGADVFTTRSTTPEELFVTTGERADQSAVGWHGVSSILTPGTNHDVCKSDIALLVLEDNVPASEARPADVLAFGPMTDHARYSTEIAAIGFGLFGAEAGTRGQRRILQHLPIQCIVGDPIFDGLSLCRNGGVFTMPDGGQEDLLDDDANFLVSWGSCPGDSGSGAFDQRWFSAGTPLVLGVLSRSATEQGLCLQPAYTRTDAWRDFLVAGATVAADVGGYPLPAWATGPTVAPNDAGALPPPPLDSTPPDASPRAAADKGASCTGPRDCASGACVAARAGESGRCVDRCGEGRTCASDETCVALASADVCVPWATEHRGPSDGGGCAVVSLGRARALPFSLGIGALGIGALALALRQRRRA